MADLTQFKYDPEAATRFFQQTKNIPEWAQRDLFAAQFKPPGQSELAQAIDALNQIRKEERDPAFQKQQLQNALEFQKEQMKQAYPYLLARQIPETMSQAFGAANALRLLGAERGTEAALRGVDAVSRGQFIPYGALPEFSYFS